MTAPTHNNLAVACNEPSLVEKAQQLADQLAVPLIEEVLPKKYQDTDYLLLFDEQGLAIVQTGKKAPGPIRVELTSGAAEHRRKFGGGKGQMIAKAVGLSAHVYPTVLDMTAGLGRDAFVLASLGARVLLSERSAIVHALLVDGLERAQQQAFLDPELQAIFARMSLLPCSDSRVAKWPDNLPDIDVVYLDPMFPSRDKSADVKKDMRAFHDLVGQDLDADDLLDRALGLARYRVVVKRPRKAPFLADKKPSYQLEGKSSRFDIYTKLKLPSKLPIDPAKSEENDQ